MPMGANPSFFRSDSLFREILACRSPSAADDEVLARLQGAPIDPSDLGLRFGAADCMRRIPIVRTRRSPRPTPLRRHPTGSRTRGGPIVVA